VCRTLVLILPACARAIRCVDPDPELRVRHRRSCGRAMDLQERCASRRSPDGEFAAASGQRDRLKQCSAQTGENSPMDARPSTWIVEKGRFLQNQLRCSTKSDSGGPAGPSDGVLRTCRTRRIDLTLYVQRKTAANIAGRLCSINGLRAINHNDSNADK
jgi:hypothetical protein